MVFHGDLVVASEAFGDSMFKNDTPACIIGTAAAKISFLHKEYVYFQHSRLQNLIITEGICIFPAFEIDKQPYFIRNIPQTELALRGPGGEKKRYL